LALAFTFDLTITSLELIVQINRLIFSKAVTAQFQMHTVYNFTLTLNSSETANIHVYTTTVWLRNASNMHKFTTF